MKPSERQKLDEREARTALSQPPESILHAGGVNFFFTISSTVRTSFSPDSLPRILTVPTVYQPQLSPRYPQTIPLLIPSLVPVYGRLFLEPLAVALPRQLQSPVNDNSDHHCAQLSTGFASARALVQALFYLCGFFPGRGEAPEQGQVLCEREPQRQPRSTSPPTYVCS